MHYGFIPAMYLMVKPLHMASISEPQVKPSSRSRSAARLKHHSAKTDMTPMVDLGFLLIAFFVMTTEMSKPSVVDLKMPKETVEPGRPLRQSNALTLLIGDKSMYYYIGDWEEAKINGVQETSFDIRNGIGKIIRERQAWLNQAKISEEGGDGLVFLIKPGPSANYQQVIHALDETQINKVKRYMIVKPSQEESDKLSN